MLIMLRFYTNYKKIKIRKFYNLIYNWKKNKINKVINFMFVESGSVNTYSFKKPIQKQPWQNYQQSRIQTYQCYCSDLKKFLVKEEYGEIKINRTGLSNGKPLNYQENLNLKVDTKIISIKHSNSIKKFKIIDRSLKGQFLKTFQITSQIPLSFLSLSLLNSFTNKYIYYAIDDILYLLDSNPTERDSLLFLLYSCMLSLHNEFSINFFDIWIDSVYFNENLQTNRFIKRKTVNLNKASNITVALKLHYFTRTPIQKPESIW